MLPMTPRAPEPTDDEVQERSLLEGQRLEIPLVVGRGGHHSLAPCPSLLREPEAPTPPRPARSSPGAPSRGKTHLGLRRTHLGLGGPFPPTTPTLANSHARLSHGRGSTKEKGGDGVQVRPVLVPRPQAETGLESQDSLPTKAIPIIPPASQGTQRRLKI